jgi:hypothetical protein
MGYTSKKILRQSNHFLTVTHIPTCKPGWGGKAGLYGAFALAQQTWEKHQ